MLAMALPQPEVIPLQEPDALTKATVTCITNITERLSPFVQTIRLAPIALATLDREMNYICYSQRFFDDFRLAQHYGYYDNLRGVNHYEAFPNIKELRPDWVEMHRRVLADGVTLNSNGMDCYKERNGDMLYMSWTIGPWHDRKGAIGGLVIHCGPVHRVAKGETLCPTCHTVITGDSQNRHTHGSLDARADGRDTESRQGDRGQLPC